MLNRIKTFAIAATFVATAATASAAIAEPLKSGPPAPEFSGIQTWLNSEPLTIQKLHGKVVLVDFWTYTCGNCVNTLPYVKSWNQKYKDQGLTVVGVHTPEFPFERDTDNVKMAIKRFGITYPVAQDNHYATWTAYDNQYWPAFYLIDKKGQVVYTHFGEGDYAQTEAAIQTLLAQKD
jgi:thiol-disulfide isomerase/thioredoxin